MSMGRSLRSFVTCVLFLGIVELASAQVPAAYQIRDLGSFGGSTFVGTAINAQGDVAGYGQLRDGTYHAFRWTRVGGLEDLGANGGWFAQAYAINDNGDVVGVYFDANSNPHGFIAPYGGAMQDLLTYQRPIQFATSITSDGRLAGAMAAFGVSHAFRTATDGSLQDLGNADVRSDAADINEAGDVTGTEGHPTNRDLLTAYRYSNAHGKEDLGTLGGGASAGAAINSSGVVVGWAFGVDDVVHAFRSRPGYAMDDLGMLGGAYPQSAALAINDSGAIVGNTTGVSGWTGFVYTDATGMIDLNTRITPPTEGWRVLNSARAINNAGQIVLEYGVLGRVGTYLLTPTDDTVPPTITAAGASPDVLTRPDGRMVPITIAISAADNIDAMPRCAITDVIDSEAPIGSPNPSVNITGALTLQLQASRLGSGDGRTYSVHVRCADFTGNAVTTVVTVNVPHDDRRTR